MSYMRRSNLVLEPWTCPAKVCGISQIRTKDQLRQVCDNNFPNKKHDFKRSVLNQAESTNDNYFQKLVDNFLVEFNAHIVSVVYDNQDRTIDMVRLSRHLNQHNVPNLFMDASKNYAQTLIHSLGSYVSLSVVLSDSMAIKKYLQHQVNCDRKKGYLVLMMA